MTPKEKAIELVEKFTKSPDEKGFYNNNQHRSKNNALICADECMLSAQWSAHLGNGHPAVETVEFWQDVKHEIELL
jgi:hypothetical protein